MRPENFDLNLIRIFLTVARCRSVTEAGNQLGLTQSSVSHALGRLRGLCNDRLFISTSKGMLPTATASAMIAPLGEAIALAMNTFQSARAFDPSIDARNFVLILSEIGELSYIPQLLDYLSRHAPHVTLNVLHLASGDHYEALAHGVADIAIGTFPADKADFHEDRLFDQPYVCMLRADHSTIHASLSLKQYLEATHVVVDPPGRGPGVVEQALAAMGRERNIVIRLPHFLAGPAILRQSDYLMSVPAWTSRLLGSPAYIKCLPLPFDPGVITAKSVWHERCHIDPGHQWFRSVVRKLLCAPDADGHAR
ncbi:LysR family transcriptional regulator [Bordetella sp. BOR01]|uniref:LysR family transcriptional regulator n=1 Tax=Bordetella sp. BOR01 TaxID=2854779 RepID=UPI001C482BB4|nr:LysR family transcriptional regulator [Bordetella sp. BOR01]MBV7486489.1 LysR family transcriptional regulator [Bordetella sp. BOR01]